MKNRSVAYMIRCVCLLGVTFFLVGIGLVMDPQADPTTETKEAPMGLAHKIEADATQIPPIDAAAPSVFETASFGLG